MNASVNGLGPMFKVSVNVLVSVLPQVQVLVILAIMLLLAQNTGSKGAVGLLLCMSPPSGEGYTMDSSVIPMPVLVPVRFAAAYMKLG